jgi:hypothetical protein
MAETAKVTPPYPPFRTFWNFIQGLEEPLPQVFEKSFFGSRSGSSRSALVAALKFFGLIDQQKRPTPKLRALIEKVDAESLRALLEESYPAVIGLGLADATRGQVDTALRDMGAPPSLLPKCRSFFVQAATEAGIEVSPFLKEAATGGSPSNGRPRQQRASTPRQPAAKQKQKQQTRQTPAGDETPAGRGLPTVVEGLVERLPKKGKKWTAEDAEQWLNLARLAFPFEYGFEFPDAPNRGAGS